MGLFTSSLQSCLYAVWVREFFLIRGLPFPVPLLFLSYAPTTPLPRAQMQCPEPVVGSPWELVPTLGISEQFSC